MGRALVELVWFPSVSLRRVADRKPLNVEFSASLGLTAVLDESLRPIRLMKSTNCDASEVYWLSLERMVCG